jgi:hypothetical protein
MLRFHLRDVAWLFVVITVLFAWFRNDLLWTERECARSAEYDRVGIAYQRAMERLRVHEPGVTGKGILPPRDPKPMPPLPVTIWRWFN